MGTTINDMVTDVTKPAAVSVPTAEQLGEGAPKPDACMKHLKAAIQFAEKREREDTMSEENKQNVRNAIRDMRAAMHHWIHMRSEEFQGR